MTRAASRAFSQRLHEEAPSVVIVRRILLFFLSIHVILSTISGYRAVVQLYRLDLDVNDRIMHIGSILQTKVVTSERTIATVQVDLVQGEHQARLARVARAEQPECVVRSAHADCGALTRAHARTPRRLSLRRGPPARDGDWS